MVPDLSSTVREDEARATGPASTAKFIRWRVSAPFKRNDQMLDVLPIGVIVFPGTGIQDNLADKASRLGTTWSDAGREMPLSNADIEALEQTLEQVRDRCPGEPMTFE